MGKDNFLGNLVKNESIELCESVGTLEESKNSEVVSTSNIFGFLGSAKQTNSFYNDHSSSMMSKG